MSSKNLISELLSCYREKVKEWNISGLAPVSLELYNVDIVNNDITLVLLITSPCKLHDLISICDYFSVSTDKCTINREMLLLTL